MTNRVVEKRAENDSTSRGYDRMSFGGNYRSESKRIIAESFDRQGISFSYESGVLVEDTKGRQRLWHPDFLLDRGVFLEYVGFPDDDKYMQGIEKKKKVYEKMGIEVVFLMPEDVWDFDRDGKCTGVRSDIDFAIRNKIPSVRSYSRSLEDSVDSADRAKYRSAA